MLAAKYGWILFTDADLSTPIEELDKFLPHLDYDIIIGSRRQEDSSIEIKQPWYRSIPGKVFPLIVNALVLRGVRDTQCGFKLFRKNVAHFLFKKQQLEGFSFDAEILWLAKRKQYSIKEIGVVWINDLDSKLHPIKDSYNMFMELLKIKYNLLKGLYR
jgi:dolichyl-phosphate beta-glucosyltransferase